MDGSSLQRELRASLGLPFFKFLPIDVIQEEIRSLDITYRDRIWNPITTLWASIGQAISADHSYKETVARVKAFRAMMGLPDCSGNTAAYTFAKQRQSEEMISCLAKQVAQQLEESIHDNHLWYGYHVKIVDGTSLTLADTAENQVKYPSLRCSPPGVGFPLTRAVGLFSAYTGAVLDFAMSSFKGKGTGESSLFRSMHSSVNAGDVVVADAYYDGFLLHAFMLRRGANLLVQAKNAEKVDFKRGKILGEEDHLIYRFKGNRPQWMTHEEYQSIPNLIQIRELGMNIHKKKRVLQTTLINPKYKKKDLAKLYEDRWDCELDLRDLKAVLQLDHLRSKSPKMATKELWLGILAHNLIRSLVAESAQEYNFEPRELSYKGALQLVTQFAPYFSASFQDASTLYNRMLKAISESVVRNRPGRVEPRKRKRRGKGDLLREHRAIARAKILQRRVA